MSTDLVKQEAEEASAYEGLEPREKAFVDYYLGEARFNGAEAARRLGYSPGGSDWTVSHRLLRSDKVQAAIAERLAEHKATSDEVLVYAARLLRCDTRSFLRQNPDGTTSVDPWQEGADGTLIKEVGRSRTGDLTLKLESRAEALALLMRHHGLLNDKLTIEGGVTYKIRHTGPGLEAGEVIDAEVTQDEPTQEGER